MAGTTTTEASKARLTSPAPGVATSFSGAVVSIYKGGIPRGGPNGGVGSQLGTFVMTGSDCPE